MHYYTSIITILQYERDLNNYSIQEQSLGALLNSQQTFIMSTIRIQDECGLRQKCHLPLPVLVLR